MLNLKGKKTENNMQTALVAGGAGFIGSHLCKSLLDKNYRVVCVDNFLTSKEDNIRKLKDNPNFSFLNHKKTPRNA